MVAEDRRVATTPHYRIVMQQVDDDISLQIYVRRSGRTVVRYREPGDLLRVSDISEVQLRECARPFVILTMDVGMHAMSAVVLDPGRPLHPELHTFTGGYGVVWRQRREGLRVTWWGAGNESPVQHETLWNPCSGKASGGPRAHGER